MSCGNDLKLFCQCNKANEQGVSISVEGKLLQWQHGEGTQKEHIRWRKPCPRN